MTKDNLYGAPWTPKILEEVKKKEAKSLLTGRYPFSELGAYIKSGKATEIQKIDSVKIDDSVKCALYKSALPRVEARDVYYLLANANERAEVCSQECFLKCFN